MGVAAPRSSPMSLLAVLVEIEDEDPVTASRPLEHFGMAQRPHRVLIAGTPMVLHGQPRELVILRLALVVPRAVNQVDDVVDFVTAEGFERLHVITVEQLFRQLAKQAGNRSAEPLNTLEMVGVGSGAARKLDLLLTRGYLEEIAGKFAACTPEIHLKREGILAEAVLCDPLQRCVRDQAAVPIIFALDFG